MFNILKNVLTFTSVIIFVGLSFGFSQNENPEENRDTVLTRGTNTTPTGSLNVTTYKLEKIRLNNPLDLKDGKPPIDYAFRLTIMTDSILPASGILIWIGDKRLGASAINPKAVAKVIYKRTLPKDATLSISKYGENAQEERSVLPEKLDVPAEYATPQEEIQAAKPKVQIKAPVPGFAYYRIIISVPDVKCTYGNLMPTVEIGEPNTLTTCNNDKFVRTYSVESFAQLRQGEPIVIRIGDKRNGRRISAGVLDKSSVEISTTNR